MADSPYAPLVHAALLARVAESKFPLVTYNNHGQEMELGEHRPPGTARTNEIAARWFPAAVNHLTKRQRERQVWRWELILQFDRQVNLEAFEDSLGTDPPRVLRDDEHDRQIELRLDSVSYVHPPQNQPTNGTRATYTFDVVATPL